MNLRVPLRARIVGLGLVGFLVGACAGPNDPISLAPTPTSESVGVPAQVIGAVTRTAGKTVIVSVSTAKRGAAAPVSSPCDPPPPPPLLHAAMAIDTLAAIMFTFKRFTEFSAVVVGEPNYAWPCQQLTNACT